MDDREYENPYISYTIFHLFKNIHYCSYLIFLIRLISHIVIKKQQIILQAHGTTSSKTMLSHREDFDNEPTEKIVIIISTHAVQIQERANTIITNCFKCFISLF